MVPTLVDPLHRRNDFSGLIASAQALISLPLSAVVIGWWWLFLVLVPSAYRNAINTDDRR